MNETLEEDTMSHHEPIRDSDGTISNDSETNDPWLARWWSVLVIGYVFLLAMFCLAITNQTFGR